MIHGLSIDVEDYHQIVHCNYLHMDIPPSPEVERNTCFLLDTFGQADVKATFFVLANVARRYPGLIRRMDVEGHEIGVHGDDHSLIYTLTPAVFREKIRAAKTEIEQIAARSVQGHRAPAFSITKDSFWALDVLKELGFVYDSSIYPIRGKRYGIPDAQKNIYRWPNGLFEVPLSCIEFFGRVVPVAGGGYMRYFPFIWTRYAMDSLEKAGRPAVVFMHPYEFEQNPPSAYPYDKNIPAALRIHNMLQAINRGERQRKKLLQLLSTYRFCMLKDLVRHVCNCSVRDLLQ